MKTAVLQPIGRKTARACYKITDFGTGSIRRQFMRKSIKPLKTNFAFALCFAALVFAACENEFMKKAFDTISGPAEVVPAPISWSTNVVYVDPLSGTLSGTVTAVLNNGGKRIWFTRVQNNKPAKQWEFKATDPTQTITAGSLAMLLQPEGLPVTSNGDTMTLNFYGGVDVDTVGQAFDSPGVSCSFILYPEALYGGDRDSIAIETATLNFRVEKPAMTTYAKYVIDKGEYGSISVSWDEGSKSLASASPPPEDISEDDIRAEMQRIAGSLAADSAEIEAEKWDASFLSNFTIDAGSLSVLSWVSPPNLSKGWAPYKKYAIELNPIFATADTSLAPVSPVISAPIQFVSNVGSAASLIKAASEAGSFASLTFVAGAEDDPYDNSGSISAALGELNISGLFEPDGDSGFSGGTKVSLTSVPAAGTYSFSVELNTGLEGSPKDSVTGLTAIYVDDTAGAP
jgi:hypothetical protein